MREKGKEAGEPSTYRTQENSIVKLASLVQVHLQKARPRQEVRTWSRLAHTYEVRHSLQSSAVLHSHEWTGSRGEGLRQKENRSVSMSVPGTEQVLNNYLRDGSVDGDSGS